MNASRLDPAFLARPIAHRGLHDKARGVIENSTSAIRAAVAAGYGIEIDLQITRDRVPLVFHDYDTKRLAGQPGYLRETDHLNLSTVTLTGSNDTIPTFADILAIVAGEVPLLVEIKDQDMRLGPSVGVLEAETARLLDTYKGPVAVMSFNPHSVEAFAELAPDVACGLVTDAFEGEDWPTVPATRRKELAAIGDAERLGVDFVSHDHKTLGSPAVSRLKSAGLPILCWTVRSESEEAEARRVADQITFEGFLPAT